MIVTLLDEIDITSTSILLFDLDLAFLLEFKTLFSKIPDLVATY